MWKGVKRTIWAVSQMALCLVGNDATAQSRSDSLSIVTATDDAYKSTPQGKSINPFFDVINPNKKGLRPIVFYGNDDRLYAGLIYNNFSRNWQPDSFGHKQTTWLHYSINQAAFSVGHQGIFNRVIGQWNLYADAGYDWVKWTNFYGAGNETMQQTSDGGYYRVRSREALIGLGFQRKLGRQSRLTLTPFYQRVQLLRDVGRFFTQTFSKEKATDVYEAKNFAGLRSVLLFQRLDDPLLPMKGAILSTDFSYVHNLAQPRSATTYGVGIKFFLPLFNRFVLSVENAASTVTGAPEFYQLASIGGNTLRGHRSDRFRGETAFHNNNELQYLFDAPWKIVNGKMGFLVFADQGRVWKKDEQSDAWHYGYGGGILLAPHHKIYLSVQYGISNERKGFHFVFRRVI